MLNRSIKLLVGICLFGEAIWLAVVLLQENVATIEKIEMDAWTAIGTIFLGAVALLTFFYDRYKNRRAKVCMSINTAPPDCHQIELTNLETGTVMSKCIYIRIRVEHISGNSAEDVEILVSNFWVVDGKEKSVKKSFIPMNLKWSHFEGKKRSIPRRLFRHCDFGSFQPKYTNNTHTVLRLDTIVQPNRVSGGEIPNVIEPGKYEFELMLSGVNSNFIRKRWLLEFDENWSDDENEMLTRHISIKERKYYNYLLSIFG
jgi:hypothetical protein